MSGLNSISGLNKVGVDYRPDVNYVDDTKGSTEAKDVQNGDVIVQNDDENVINIPNPIGGEEVGSLLQQLDVLLVNAAKRSVTTDAAQKTRNALNTVVGDKDAIGGDTLVDLGIITKDEAARLFDEAVAGSPSLVWAAYWRTRCTR